MGASLDLALIRSFWRHRSLSFLNDRFYDAQKMITATQTIHDILYFRSHALEEKLFDDILPPGRVCFGSPTNLPHSESSLAWIVLTQR